MRPNATSVYRGLKMLAYPYLAALSSLELVVLPPYDTSVRGLKLHAALRYLELVVVQPENADVLKDGLKEHSSWQTVPACTSSVRLHTLVA
jgi:hypothetical protein